MCKTCGLTTISNILKNYETQLKTHKEDHAIATKALKHKLTRRRKHKATG
jgi:hypothetical protein